MYFHWRSRGIAGSGYLGSESLFDQGLRDFLLESTIWTDVKRGGALLWRAEHRATPCISVHIYIYKCTYVYIYICIYIYLYTYICTYTCTHPNEKNKEIHIHVYTYTSICAYTHICVCVSPSIYICKYIYIYMRIHLCTHLCIYGQVDLRVIVDVCALAYGRSTCTCFLARFM